MNPRVFIYNKKGELVFEAEKMDDIWVVFPYKESRLLNKTDQFNEENFDLFVSKCKACYPIINFL